MSVEFDPYALLGTSRDASDEEIRNIYRRVARRMHPDQNKNNPGAAVQFADINAAYHLLTNVKERESYDREVEKRPKDPLTFTLRVTPSKRNLFPLEEKQVVYMLAEIIPDPRAEESKAQIRQQTHLNLTLVLDISKSMHGGRMHAVQVAANKIIDQLTAQDVLSVVSFNDYAEVVIPATTVSDPANLKARIAMLKAFGGTEMYKGLSAGVEQNKQYLAPRLVNHVILITDGHTYGDHERCIALAKQAKEAGIAISAMGLGDEWNDEFLDQLASETGGASSYIKSSSQVVGFMHQHVRSLSNAFAERLSISVAPDIGVRLESAFKLMPNPQPLSIQEGEIPLGSLQINRTTTVLLQFEIPANLPEGYHSIARIVAAGEIMANANPVYHALSDTSLGVMYNPPSEETPAAIMDALSRLTLYRQQERANEAFEQGDYTEAANRLEKLATRLFQLGEGTLAEQVRQNAQQITHTQTLSAEGRKDIKYHTRHLIGGGQAKSEMQEEHS